MRTRVYLGILILLAFVSLLSLPAHAQFTTITATDIQAGDGSPLAAGSMCWLGTNNAGTAIGYRAGTSGQTITAPVCRDIVSGAVATTYKGVAKGALQVADTTLTQPANVCYKVTVTDTSTGKVVLGSYAGAKSGYDCVQPSGSTWSFDTYTPAGTPNVVQVAGPTGPQGPLGPIGPAGTLAANTGLTATATFSDPDMTIAVLPDLQCPIHNATSGSCTGTPALADAVAMTNWITTNATSLGIKAVVGVGDVVDQSGVPQDWTNADTVFAPLISAGIPWIEPPGNHDFDAPSGQNFGVPSSRLTTNFKAHIYDQISGTSFFAGAWATNPEANNWIKFTNGAQTYGVLALEDCPRPGALTWAEGVLAANPTIKFIITTHQNVYWDNTLMNASSNQSCASYSLTDGGEDGADVWTNFTSKHDGQIIAVVSGHIGGSAQWSDVGRALMVGSNGFSVPQMAQNYQFSNAGGDGYLRLYTFHPSKATIDVQTYSPARIAYHSEEWNQFTVSYGSNKAAGAVATKGDIVSTGDVVAAGAVRAKDVSAQYYNRFFRMVYGTAPADDCQSFTMRRSTVNGTTILNAPCGGPLYLNADFGTGVSIGDGTGTGNAPNGLQWEWAPASNVSKHRVFSNTGSITNKQFLRYRGTNPLPTSVLANDSLMRLSAAGYDGVQAIGSISESAALLCYVSTDFTATNHGTGCLINTTPNGSTTPQTVLNLLPNGTTQALISMQAPYLFSMTANPAVSGLLRMAHADAGASWRNNANTGDCSFGMSGSTDTITLNGSGCTMDATKLSGTVPAASISQLPKVVATVSSGAQTASIGTTTLTTPAAAGTYRVSLVVNTEVAGTAGTVLATMVWNTGAGSNQSTATATANLATLGEQKQTTQVIRVGAGTNITYSTTVASATGSPQYRVSAIVEQLQ